MSSPLDANRANPVANVEPAQAVAGRIPKAFRERVHRCEQAGNLRDLGAVGRRIERGDDVHAGLRVLVRDQRQQRPGADEGDASADRYALRLERDLRAAEREDSGQGPARKRQHAVHRAGREQEVVERLPAEAFGREQVETVPEHIPDQRARPVVDPILTVAEHAMDRFSLLRFETVDVEWHATDRAGWLTIDLAARPLGLVEEDRSQARASQRFGAAHTGRARADDDDDRLSQGRPLR